MNTNEKVSALTGLMALLLSNGDLKAAIDKAAAECKCARCTARRREAELTAMDERDAKAAAESAAAEYATVGQATEPAPPLVFAHELVAVLSRYGITEARMPVEHNGKAYVAVLSRYGITEARMPVEHNGKAYMVNVYEHVTNGGFPAAR